jgi:hypothetical protein
MARTIATPNAMPHSVLSTVFDHCTPTIRGKTATSVSPYSCIPPLLVSIKGGGGHPLKGSVDSLDTDRSEHTHLLLASDIVIRHAQNPTSSRDLGASLPLSPRLYPLLQALRV